MTETAITRAEQAPRNGAVVRPLAGQPTDIDLMTLGQIFAASGFFQDSRQQAQAIVKILAGRELGFAPVASMTGIYIVKGRVTLSANLIAAAIRNHPRYDYAVIQSDDTTCEIEFTRDDKPIGRSKFTIDQAKRAGLAGGDNWKAYPEDMLFARAMSRGAKRYTPDVFNGAPIYTPDEIPPDHDGETVIITPAGEVVNAGTGEVLPPVNPRAQAAVQAGETHATYGEAAGLEPEPLKVRVAKAFQAVSGFTQVKTKEEVAAFRGYICRTLGEDVKLTTLSDAQLSAVLSAIERVPALRSHGMGLWGKLAAARNLDAADATLCRQEMTRALHRPVDTRKLLAAPEWEAWIAHCEAALGAPAPDDAPPATSDPFVDEAPVAGGAG